MKLSKVLAVKQQIAEVETITVEFAVYPKSNVTSTD